MVNIGSRSLNLPLFRAPKLQANKVEDPTSELGETVKDESSSNLKRQIRKRKSERVEAPPPKRRGRPKGSTLSEKPAESAAPEQQQKKSSAKTKSSRTDENNSKQVVNKGAHKSTAADKSPKTSKSSAGLRTSKSQKTEVVESTRLRAKKTPRAGAHEKTHRSRIITEADFLAKRDEVNRKMIVRDLSGHQQVAILEDGILVEHYVSEQSEASLVGNVYLGQVQNVLPGIEAAFVDIGAGRNGVLYAGEVNWDESGLVNGEPRRIEQALQKGDTVLVQVTKDPVGQKGARLTSQVTLAGRFLVLVPSSGITGISKKIPDRERTRLKSVVKEFVTKDYGIIIRTAATGVDEKEIVHDITTLLKKWEEIENKASKSKAPAKLHTETSMVKRLIREVFDSSFDELVVDSSKLRDEVKEYISATVPDLLSRVVAWTPKTGTKQDIFSDYRIDEQLQKAMTHKVWLPSGGTIVIDKTEAMTVIDVNTGKFTGNNELKTLEDTVTTNNLEAAEEIVRQLRLRDVGGIVVIDFIDMIMESNRELVLKRLIECLMRDRTRHQVAEVTSLGLVQLTRKRVGQGLIEAFSTRCTKCSGLGYIVHSEPVEKDINSPEVGSSEEEYFDNFSGASHELDDGTTMVDIQEIDEEKRIANKKRLAAIAKAANQTAE
ncbi:MAG: Rne/Rng family ribonuclease [Candidatus Ancillula trichonymphae]|jgi:ribonuclease E|nr:Rne/Rng family ribonuclease [Candidatus Ancillula trichonymphae]